MTDPAVALDHAFDRDTEVEAVSEHRSTLTISDRWNALGDRVNGGYLMAVCLAALRREVPLPDPLVVSAFFLRPAAAGPVEIATELVRPGRRIATGEAQLRQGGKEIVRLVASFTDFAATPDGRRLELGAKPELPPPDACVDPIAGRSPLRRPGIANQVEWRAVEPPGWVLKRPGGDPTLTMWMRWRDGRPTDVASLPLFVDALPPPVLDLGETGSSTVELTVHVRGVPAPGWVAGRSTTRHVGGGYHEEDFEIWDETGGLVAQSRQLAILL